MKSNEANHYFLIAGIMLFTTDNDGVQTLGSTPANAIVRHDTTMFGVRKLAKAQQNLHASFVAKLPEEMHGKVTVFDIVITNVSYLGHMTEEEFQHVDPIVAEDNQPVPERV